MIYFSKCNDTRTSKTMFPGVWHPNTQIQIHKYTNTQIQFGSNLNFPTDRINPMPTQTMSVKNENRLKMKQILCAFFSTDPDFSLLKQTVSVVKKNLKKWCFEFSSTINGCATLFVFWRDTKSVVQPLIVELNSKTPFF